MRARSLLWWMVAVLLMAAILRAAAFGEVPPGLYHDEAYHGLDSLDVLQGRFSLYFPVNNGREPLFIYLIAMVVGLLGRSPFALRLAAFPIGVLTVAATGAMGRVLFSRRVGLLAAAVLAVTLWHVHLSRTGFRAVLLPLFIALAVWQVALGVRKAGRRGDPHPGPLPFRERGEDPHPGPLPSRERGEDPRPSPLPFRERGRDSHPGPLPSREGGGPRRGWRWWWHWLAAGALYGLSFYTYTAARFTPVALTVFGLYILATRPAISKRLWRGVGLAGLAALVTLMPLALYTVGHPDVVLGRPGQVSILNPAIHGGDPWGTLGAHVLRTLGMFFVRGDRIWRHNVPWRPVFDPLLGVAFLVGLVVALRRVRHDPAAGFVLLWTAVMGLPTLLAEDAPHFLRAVGILPVVALLPALGLDRLAALIRSSLPDPNPPVGRPSPALLRAVLRSSLRTMRYSVIGHLAILVFPLLFGLGSTAWAYFGDYAHNPMTGYWFEQGATTLAGRVNGFLGLGWDGARMLHGDPEGRWVYLDPELWEKWPQVHFLVAAPEKVTIIPPLPGRERAGVRVPPLSLEGRGGVAVFVWPYDDWQRAWTFLPSPAEISVEEGPLSQGDRDPEPYVTYLAFFATPPDPAVPSLARFSGGVELLGVQISPLDAAARLPTGADGGGVCVRLRWRATAPLTEDYTVFLHYLRDGERVAQADSRPACGRYPTTAWRPGDVINDDHFIYPEGGKLGTPSPDNDTLLFGLWRPATGEVLYLLDEAGNPAGDWIEVPVGEVGSGE